jgi:glucose/arabinose dehydrogenase
MRRPLVLLLAAAVGVGLLPPTQAWAAISAVKVVDCVQPAPDCWPTAFKFTPSGRIWYVERFTGEIRKYDPQTGTDRLWRTVPDVNTTESETGLLGLALDPRWSQGRTFQWVYVYFTKDDPFENRIHRYRKRTDGTFVSQKLETVAADNNHNGGVIHFGPDGKLYAVVGEVREPERSQDTSDPNGKVLRMTKTGLPANGNPFGNVVFSYGLRNSFGFAFDPETGNLWETENGPTCNDEINLIELGGNYGWGPSWNCTPPIEPEDTNQDGPDPILPEQVYEDPFAPTGAIFCDGCGLGPAASGDLLFGDHSEGIVRQLDLDAERDDVTAETQAYDHPRGILAMAAAPNRSVYFSDRTGIYRLVQT